MSMFLLASLFVIRTWSVHVIFDILVINKCNALLAELDYLFSPSSLPVSRIGT
jgi:hypothetical protein